MTKIIESTKAQYDTVEVPFGRSYRWHQAHVVLECDCGEKLTSSATSAINASSCRCGADYGALIHSIRGPRMSNPGTTISKVKRTNTSKTRLHTLVARAGATTILRLALLVRMNRDGRRLGRQVRPFFSAH